MGSFLESWSMFGSSYLLALGTAVALSVIGVLVVARREVFIGAAAAEASTLGVALAWWLALKFGMDADSTGAGAFEWIGAMGFAVLAALWTMSDGQSGSGGASRGLAGDERTAVVFVGAAVLSMLLLVNLPQGREQLQRVQASSLIGAATSDAIIALLAAIAAVAVTQVWRRSLVLLISDPVMASAVGLKARQWHLGIAIATGLVIGLSLRGTGTVFTFGCLILPTLVAKQLVGTIGRLFIVAPVVAVIGVLGGLFFAHMMDLPPGQVTIGTLLLGLLIARGYRFAAERFWLMG